MFSAMRAVWEMLLVMFLAVCSKTIGAKHNPKVTVPSDRTSYCSGWRVAVEANNVRAWRTVPTQCLHYVENYMVGGQYERDLEVVIEQMYNYIKDIVMANNGTDAWILDVDDTCISNLFYYRGKRFGCDPYDPTGFKTWASKGNCPAIPTVLGLFKKLVGCGFKVFLVTGRDAETLGQATINNLHMQGFVDYERLIMRTPTYRGQGAVSFKSEIRKQLVEQGYRIWGNVGDQWSDINGECLGDRTFKLPNPMYFVP